MSGGAVDADLLLSLPGATRRRRELQPLVHAVLERAGRIGELPASEREAARQAYAWSAARGAVLQKTLKLLLDEATAADVVVLPLKGSLLAHAVYPEPAARPMGDLDLAVRPRDLERYAGRLERHGFRRAGLGRRRFDLRRTHHLLLTHPRAPLVELHVGLVHELGADPSLDQLYDRAIEVTLLGRTVRAPSWEDHAFYVALHAATHGFCLSPLWVFDLALLAGRVRSFREVEDVARRRRAVAALHFAFELARRYVPWLPRRLAPPGSRAARAAVLRLVLGDDPLSLPPARLRSLLARFALTDRPSDVARALVDKASLRAAELLLERRPPPP